MNSKLLTTSDLKILITSKVEELINEIAEFDNRQIMFYSWNKNYSSCHQYKNLVEIFLDRANGMKTDTILHELLHLWVNKFTLPLNDYIYQVSIHYSLSDLFDEEFRIAFANLLEHKFFYHKYVELDGKPENFVTVGNKQKASIINVLSLILKKKDSTNFKKHFIWIFSAIKADHIANNYIIHLKLLKLINRDLFNSCNSFWQKWGSVKPIINSITTNISITELLDSFFTELNCLNSK